MQHGFLPLILSNKKTYLWYDHIYEKNHYLLLSQLIKKLPIANFEPENSSLDPSKHPINPVYDFKKIENLALYLKQIKKIPDCDNKLKQQIFFNHMEYTKKFLLDTLKESSSAHSNHHVSTHAATIVVMTEVVWGTLGDFYAALKLIVAMKAQNPAQRIVWFLMEKDRNIPKENMPCDEYHVYNSWGELFSKTETLLLIFAGLVVQFPTFHFFPEKEAREINNSRHMLNLEPMLNIIEYDYVLDANNHYSSNASNLRTGLGDDALGIFLDETVLTAEQMMQNISEHSIAKPLFQGTSLTEYQQHHACYFGYRNKSNSAVNYIDSIYFISLVIALHHAKQDGRMLDIIVPLTQDDLDQLRSLVSYCQQYNIGKIIIYNKNDTCFIDGIPGGITVRFFNEFPFPNHIFRALMHLAEKQIMLCTGDQSLSDLLSIPGAIPIYQIMSWKENLYDEFLSTVEKVCGTDSSLYKVLYLFSPHDNSGNRFNYAWLANYLVFYAEKMSSEMLQVNAYLHTHKNLYHNLPQRLHNSLVQSKNTLIPESSESSLTKNMKV